MKLRDLNAQFTKTTFPVVTWNRVKAGCDPLNYTEADIEEVTGPKLHYQHVDSLADADGIWFDCPCAKCRAGYAVRHVIGFTGRCPPDTYCKGSDGKDTRWEVALSSTGLDDLVLTPSIQTVGACGWHGFVGSSGVPPGEAA